MVLVVVLVDVILLRVVEVLTQAQLVDVHLHIKEVQAVVLDLELLAAVVLVIKVKVWAAVEFVELVMAVKVEI
jgi:uncharacterized protein involved in response to NO